MNTRLPDFQVNWPGHVVIVGFGSIGSAVLPLLRRHFPGLRGPLTVIDPDPVNRAVAGEFGARFLQEAITEDNHRRVLGPLLEGRAPAMLVNLSTEVSSADLVRLAWSVGAMYIDTVTEPWPGHYFNAALPLAERSNYALREALLALRGAGPGAPTAISCCGANPGMVSWFVKQALLDIARATGSAVAVPADRAGWAQLMMRLGVKGVHIAERDGQRAAVARSPGCFLNTWSVQGLIAEALQPAELGWGTHEGSLPADGHAHATGCQAAIWLDHPGGTQRVATWTPTAGAHFGYIISHNEAISIADQFTVRDAQGRVRYRPTCLYAYRPADLTVDSLEEFFAGGRQWPRECRVLRESDIAGGADDLGVLLYGHGRNAYWYGSRLDIDAARALAPYQNATGLQVASAVIAAMAWAVAHPRAGLVEADDMDFAFCLRHQAPYLGELGGHFTDWQPPLREGCSDPWAFGNMRLA